MKYKVLVKKLNYKTFNLAVITDAIAKGLLGQAIPEVSDISGTVFISHIEWTDCGIKSFKEACIKQSVESVICEASPEILSMEDDGCWMKDVTL